MKKKNKTNEKKTHKFFKIENKTSKEEIELLLITEAIKKKEK